VRAISGSQSASLDALARERLGCSSEDLILKAAAALSDRLSGLGLLPLAAPVVFLVGSGDNGADGVALASLLVSRWGVIPDSLAIILAKQPSSLPPHSPLSRFIAEAETLGVRTAVWGEDVERIGRLISGARTLVDGIAGTGLRGPLRGPQGELAYAVSRLCASKGDRPLRIAVDLPSGAYDLWKRGDPVLSADLTLAVEFPKRCCYLPGLRSSAGSIRVVTGVFPASVKETADGVTLAAWNSVSRAEAMAAIPWIRPDAHKGSRGTVVAEVGSPNAVGAAKIALRGALAAGCGLAVARVDPAVATALQASEFGPVIQTNEQGQPSPDSALPARRPDCLLVGPGWGRSAPRSERWASLMEEVDSSRCAVVVDADGLYLCADSPVPHSASGTIFTPHPGEASRILDCSVQEILDDPDTAVSRLVRVLGGVVILKGHVPRVCAPDGRLVYLDGNHPILATGGSGDALAGMIAGIAARSLREERDHGRTFDPFSVAIAALALLFESASRCQGRLRLSPIDEVLDTSISVAGEAWLPRMDYAE